MKFNEFISLILGKKRRRTNGAGNKLKYIQLDSLLLAWYREHRTTLYPNVTVPPTDIRREKITFNTFTTIHFSGEKSSKYLFLSVVNF